MSEAVAVVRRGGVLEVTLDRPPVNAIDIPTSVALGEAFARRAGSNVSAGAGG